VICSGLQSRGSFFFNSQSTSHPQYGSANLDCRTQARAMRLAWGDNRRRPALRLSSRQNCRFVDADLGLAMAHCVKPAFFMHKLGLRSPSVRRDRLAIFVVPFTFDVRSTWAIAWPHAYITVGKFCTGGVESARLFSPSRGIQGC